MLPSIAQANLECNIRCQEAIIMHMYENRFQRPHTIKAR